MEGKKIAVGDFDGNWVCITTAWKWNSPQNSQPFKDKCTLMEALGTNALQARLNFYAWKNKSDKYMARCIDDSCKWRLCTNKYLSSSRFIITVYCKLHTCNIQHVSTKHSKASCIVIERHIMSKFKEAMGIIPKQIQKEVSNRFGCEISYWKAYQVGIIAKESVRESTNDGYSKLIPYSWSVRSTNSGSKIDLQLNKDGRFLYYFLAFEAWIKGFKHMRKVIVVDVTHVKGKYEGVLLTDVAQDLENHVFPLACCVVGLECDASWNYFFQQLHDIVPNSLDLCIISDRHHSIRKAIQDVYTNAHHGVCTGHLFQRIPRRFHNGSFEKLFYKAEKAYTSEVFYDHFSEIQHVASNVADFVKDALGFNK